MNTPLKVNSLLIAVTLISAAAPASAITQIGNAKAPQIAICVCQEKTFSDRFCPRIHCVDKVESTSSDQIPGTISSETEHSILIAHDWFDWNRQDRQPQPR
ncbi:hypothetical protein NIES2111_66400 (plasmid) [Nostoc sp. NIES-2111]|nr:hypothetical protein NIES2111_66400 [Nostoc sp. NIES-2111]